MSDALAEKFLYLYSKAHLAEMFLLIQKATIGIKDSLYAERNFFLLIFMLVFA